MARNEKTSYLKINTSKYLTYKRDAIRSVIRYINDDDEISIKTAIDMMAGVGTITSHLLLIEDLERLIINDLAEDCYSYLQKKFNGTEKINGIFNRDFFEFDLEEKTDLVVVDFNNFTINKKYTNLFLEWLRRNREYFSYLLYSDSFHYSLKFIKGEQEKFSKYKNYLKRVEELLAMKIIFHYEYRNNDCSLILLKEEKN